MSPTRMVGPGEGGEILTPAPDETVARLGEVAALRAMTDTMNRMGQAMQGMMDEQKQVVAMIGELRTDVAVMKLQDERIRKVEHEQGEQAKEIASLKLSRASDEGARKGLVSAREWGPTVITILAVLFAMIKTGALHL